MGYIQQIKESVNAPDLFVYCDIAQRKPSRIIRSVKFELLDKTRGLKTFYNEQLRDESFCIQRYLAHYGLSPKAYTRLFVGKEYSFVTEVVPDLLPSCKKYYTLIKNLINKCGKVGIINRDWHKGNVGFLRGKLVLLDVNDCILDKNYFSKKELDNFFNEWL